MVDSHLTVTDASLRTHFATKAVLPQREAARATTFVDALEKRLASGGQATKTDLDAGNTILHKLQEQQTRFEFSFAQVIAAEAGDIDKKVEEISTSIANIEGTAERLRAVLGKLGA